MERTMKLEQMEQFMQAIDQNWTEKDDKTFEGATAKEIFMQGIASVVFAGALIEVMGEFSE